MDRSSILSHVSLGTNDMPAAVRFYDAVMAALGARRLVEHDEAIAWGRVWPEFWVNVPLDNGPASPGNGVHVAFAAASRDSPGIS